MVVKAVFFDIDGTLLTDGRTVSRSTIVAINALKKQGILLGIATGRDPQFLLPYMSSLGLDVAIAYNGQYIFSRDDVFFSQALNKTEVKALVSYASEQGKALSFGTARGIEGSRLIRIGTGKSIYRLTRLVPSSWARTINFIVNRMIRKLKSKNTITMEEIPQQPVYQMILLVTERETEWLIKRFPNLSFTRSSPYAADVITKGNSKFQAIKRVGERYHFSAEEVMVFGDSNNDLEMLEGVGYAVAMGNATAAAKNAATYVTDSNNHDGIYKALSYFGLVGEDSVSK